jgi:hypothetical protein
MFSMIISFSHIKENRDKRSGAMAGKSMNTTLRHGVMSRIVETFEASVSGRPEVYLKITKANRGFSQFRQPFTKIHSVFVRERRVL